MSLLNRKETTALVRKALSQIPVRGLERIVDYCRDRELHLTGSIYDPKTGAL